MLPPSPLPRRGEESHLFRRGGPSILASLFSTFYLWEERLNGTSFLLPCLCGEGVSALHVLPISEQGLRPRKTCCTMHVSSPQCAMSRARSLGWVCMEERCSPASHPISCGVAFFQHSYFCRFFCATFWFLLSCVAVRWVVRRYFCSLFRWLY